MGKENKLKMLYRACLFSLLVLGILSCSNNNTSNETDAENPLNIDNNPIIMSGNPGKLVIAHRGMPYHAPEETAPAFLLAREIGADYLEADLQRTKDGIIIALHDENLLRTTNIETVFPDRKSLPASEFTLEEIKMLDAGSWFNEKHPNLARKKYEGLKILSLDELIDIAEDGKNKPGLYLETKKANLFPGIEKDLFNLLDKRGWIKGDPDKKIILQTFEKESLLLLNEIFPAVPKLWLLWLGDGYMDTLDKEHYQHWVEFGFENGANFIGPSIPGPPNDFADLTQDWMIQAIRNHNLDIHAYTFDTREQIIKYAPLTQGQFTNRSDLLLRHYNRPCPDVDSTLKALGY